MQPVTRWLREMLGLPVAWGKQQMAVPLCKVLGRIKAASEQNADGWRGDWTPTMHEMQFNELVGEGPVVWTSFWKRKEAFFEATPGAEEEVRKGQQLENLQWLGESSRFPAGAPKAVGRCVEGSSTWSELPASAWSEPSRRPAGVPRWLRGGTLLLSLARAAQTYFQRQELIADLWEEDDLEAVLPIAETPEFDTGVSAQWGNNSEEPYVPLSIARPISSGWGKDAYALSRCTTKRDTEHIAFRELRVGAVNAAGAFGRLSTLWSWLQITEGTTEERDVWFISEYDGHLRQKKLRSPDGWRVLRSWPGPGSKAMAWLIRGSLYPALKQERRLGG